MICVQILTSIQGQLGGVAPTVEPSLVPPVATPTSLSSGDTITASGNGGSLLALLLTVVACIL